MKSSNFKLVYNSTVYYTNRTKTIVDFISLGVDYTVVQVHWYSFLY